MEPPLPQNESDRLRALHSIHMLGSDPETSFDRLTEMATQVFEAPLALISLIGEERLWIKSMAGSITRDGFTGDNALCEHTIHTNDGVFVVTDASQDSRFADNPLVKNTPNIRFYAGWPLRLDGDVALGSFCIVDTKPRQFSKKEQHLLETLGKQAEELLKFRATRKDLEDHHRQALVATARYGALIGGASAGILRLNGEGLIQDINPFASDLLGYSPHELSGRPLTALVPDTERYGFSADGQPADRGDVFDQGREMTALDHQGCEVPVHISISKTSLPEDNYYEYIAILTDLTEYRRMTREQDRQRLLLTTLHTGLTDYHALMEGDRLWHFLLQALRDLTDSEYGLIGEVITEENGPALRIHALTDLSWSEGSRVLLESLRAGNMTLTNPDTLLGQVFSGGKTVIANDPMTDARRAGLPKGHPPLNSYLGVPIQDGDQIIGMYAIANGKAPYDQETAAWLEPFTATCALLINLRRQLAERDRFTAELAAARDEAERANQAKTDFLSAMSHELRTPLNSILGFTQLLANSRRHPLNDKQQRQIHQIERSGHHLLDLINEVLDLARIESGRLDLSLETLPLGEVVAEAVGTIRGFAEQYGVTLTSPAPPALWPSVRADYTRLKQVLLNLLSNAIKYNRSAGTVELSHTVSDGYAWIHCTDTGIGLSASEQQRLFEPFDRLGADEGIEGTGIGLALTLRLVEAMEGRLHVDSLKGVGSDFQVALPLVATPDETPNHDRTEPVTSQLRPENNGARSVLYVEDNPANQRLMQEAFEDHSQLHLTCVHSAELALDMATAAPPALIIMDINLPGMDGVEALQSLKAHPATRSVPVVALSANAMKGDIEEGLRAGFIDYLTKPVDLDRLFELLEKVTSRHE